MTKQKALPVVKIIFSTDEMVTFPISKLISERETLYQISDAELTERAAKWLGKSIQDLSDSVISRLETGDILIVFKAADREGSESVPKIAEVQANYLTEDAPEAVQENEANPLMAQIEFAADCNDVSAFAQAVENIEWQFQPVDTLLRVIEMALSLNHIALARRLTQIGQEQFPDNEQLKKAARVLAPPVTLGVGPATPELNSTVAWVKEHAAEYQGQWIAVRAGELMAHASSLDELIEKAGGLGMLEETLVHRVV